MKHTELTLHFVKGVPRDLAPGVLYVSMEYGTVVHSCCCGCGHEVVTPLTPTDWRLTFDGETISLWPSVGNWNLPCRSHYVIKNNRVAGAEFWDKARIEAEQKRNKTAKAKFYAQSAEPILPEQCELPQLAAAVPTRNMPKGLWAKLCRLFG
ncbi:hypothetical protein SAMN05720354_108123 [Nitrosospira sp. Nsp1]|nr:hypothetical protein SAMN05720354_108123 [Nitrosospira sp. Nsp1]